MPVKKILLLLLVPIQLLAQNFSGKEISRWQHQAKQVTITRDNWGIPHISGNTDADAVFGLLYAQCEDDFKRVELNYIEKLGRMAEIKGEAVLYDDLLLQLLIDTADAKKDYNTAAPWLKKLLNAYADGINYYLYKNPQVKPLMIHRFQPWYPLLWTDGSIGAINTADISTAELKNFYSGDAKPAVALAKDPDQQTGSNGFAFGPSVTASGNAILYINPHVTFYFRPEVQVTSKEGLNAYGAVTWGQFFVYQGFNEHCGWMHTSNNVDVADLYEEKISTKNKQFFYEYDHQLKPVRQKKIVLRFAENGLLKTKNITAFFTQHGPVMAMRNNKWISLKSFNRSAISLKQSWLRTKAKGFDDYKKVMDLKANTSNNTVYADDKGNIAYWHGNFIPIRDKKLNWALPVDGSTSATEWKGLHEQQDIVHLFNPPNGWLQNCNSTPFSVAGNYSPKKENYPAYMAPDGENFRGVNAVRILGLENKYTVDKVIAAGYNTYLSAFEVLVPALINSFEKSIASGDTTYNNLKEPIAILKTWDYHSGESSVATTLAIEWAQKLDKLLQKVYVDEGETDQVQNTKHFAAVATAAQLLPPLTVVVNELTGKFGNWQIAWGTINRFQRITDNIPDEYHDSLSSLPMGFASALWGQIPSYNSKYFARNKKRYGVSGNSFICAVEFGKKIIAKSLLAGGESGDPSSKHFKDQAEMYTHGQFKEVLFYPEDIAKHAEKKYHPGE
ncbi:MAG: peptidase penicillin amidase [Ferruginibacter sp.]|uniref:penicillin acylase family protein n=1 Tax=Ferruginibacter sp. TaxID=1940288 RepID=UPI00265930B6|nr:penicillin acylase family protein [Ferruginibacter sp.]MDB5280760.1 peptidase penicillin amidase [Ferruginibacter sp.]